MISIYRYISIFDISIDISIYRSIFDIRYSIFDIRCLYRYIDRYIDIDIDRYGYRSIYIDIYRYKSIYRISNIDISIDIYIDINRSIEYRDVSIYRYLSIYHIDHIDLSNIEMYRFLSLSISIYRISIKCCELAYIVASLFVFTSIDKALSRPYTINGKHFKYSTRSLRCAFLTSVLVQPICAKGHGPSTPAQSPKRGF